MISRVKAAASRACQHVSHLASRIVDNGVNIVVFLELDIRCVISAGSGFPEETFRAELLPERVPPENAWREIPGAPDAYPVMSKAERADGIR